MKAYTVKPGHRFVIPANGESGTTVVEAGGVVYMDDAEAARFADRVTLKRAKATKPAPAAGGREEGKDAPDPA